MSALDALVEAAPDGVDYDGLTVEERADGFTFAVPGTERAGLDGEALRDAATAHAEYVQNWHHWTHVVSGETKRAFLRWIEGAPERSVPERYAALGDGVTRTWGQLAVTARLDSPDEAAAGAGAGTATVRRYDLRHVDDRGREDGDLETHDDPREARSIVTFDDDGDYRPLKTAPTLPTGWAFPDLSGPDLVRAVEFAYPASVANWHRERAGDLDVSHFRETAERQTGIYAVVDDLDPAGVANLAEACCVDSQCVKRREWDEDGDAPLDVPRGDGEFPCREPCSLAIAAARKFAILEGETERSYTFELTPSEKNQLEEILDAVADGRVDEIREADLGDGANRYRARYLRAKRMTDRGLSDVPTVPDQDDST